MKNKKHTSFFFSLPGDRCWAPRRGSSWGAPTGPRWGIGRPHRKSPHPTSRKMALRIYMACLLREAGAKSRGEAGADKNAREWASTHASVPLLLFPSNFVYKRIKNRFLPSHMVWEKKNPTSCELTAPRFELKRDHQKISKLLNQLNHRGVQESKCRARHWRGMTWYDSCTQIFNG